MAKQRPRVLSGRKIRPGRRPQRRPVRQPKRPIRIKTRDVVRPEVRAKDTWWFTLHRRGVGGRPKVGTDPLEARAIPESRIRGYLHERIVWRYLVVNMRFSPDASGAPNSFDFQSSQFGGRQELGGLVIDFLFQYYKIGLEVEGPQHNTFMGGVRDEERKRLAALLGLRLISLPISIVENVGDFENFMRRLFDMMNSNTSGYAVQWAQGDVGVGDDWDAIWRATCQLRDSVDKAIVAVNAGT